MKLLIVEDDKATIQSYIDNIESFNKTSSISIKYEVSENINSAKTALLGLDYDGAIIDLKLSSHTTTLEGIEIVDEIQNKHRFPIFIVSGSISQIEKEENAFLKKRSRDTDFKSILRDLLAIYTTGITQILGKKGCIEDYLNIIFWNHLSNSMDVWIDNTSKSPEETQKSLLRYTLLHIQEYLEITEDSGFEHYHPAEIYITPVIKPMVFTGDIVVNNNTNEKFIILSPSCDLAQSKAKELLLGFIEDSNTGLLNEKINIIKKKKASYEIIIEAENSLKNLIKNSYSNKYHFLPEYKDINAGIINFQKINSIRVKDFNDNFTRIASINSTFTKDIIARFSYYYSRQGSPDFNLDEVYSSIINQKN